MALLSKVSSGLLYREVFQDNLSLIWEVTPDDYSRVSINTDSVSLLPGPDKLEMLIPAPQACDYIFQTKVLYKPTLASESGGCVFKSVTENYCHLEIKGDDDVNCTNIKLSIDEAYIINARTTDSVTGKWINHGNTRLVNANYIGFYMRENTALDSLKIYEVNMYKSNFITINNFDRTQIIKLFDNTGTEVTSKFYIKKRNTKMIIDGTDKIFPIDFLNVKIYDSTGTEISSNDLTDIYGGDEYDYAQNITFAINNVVLTGDTHSIGGVDYENIYSLKITNNEMYRIENKKLKIEAYDPYNPGHHNVYIASLIAETVVGEYEKIKTGITFKPAETREFSLKVVKSRKALLTDEDYKFRITLE